MRYVIAGVVLMSIALGLQLAMVARAIAPDVLLSLGGYLALFAGMGLVLAGVLRRRR